MGNKDERIDELEKKLDEIVSLFKRC